MRPLSDIEPGSADAEPEQQRACASRPNEHGCLYLYSTLFWYGQMLSSTMRILYCPRRQDRREGKEGDTDIYVYLSPYIAIYSLRQGAPVTHLAKVWVEPWGSSRDCRLYLANEGAPGQPQ